MVKQNNTKIKQMKLNLKEIATTVKNVAIGIAVSTVFSLLKDATMKAIKRI